MRDVTDNATFADSMFRRQFEFLRHDAKCKYRFISHGLWWRLTGIYKGPEFAIGLHFDTRDLDVVATIVPALGPVAPLWLCGVDLEQYLDVQGVECAIDHMKFDIDRDRTSTTAIARDLAACIQTNLDLLRGSSWSDWRNVRHQVKERWRTQKQDPRKLEEARSRIVRELQQRYSSRNDRK